MQLSKRIPARTKTYKLLWLRKEFTIFNDTFRKARSRMKRKLSSCEWCKSAFNEGDMVALAAVEGKRNMVLCQNCANDAEG